MGRSRFIVIEGLIGVGKTSLCRILEERWKARLVLEPCDDNPFLAAFLLSQSSPQIIRHVRFVHRATTDYRTRVYIKVGTTGTGGMGLNIPYTHSEDKPSKKLLAKTEAAFGHTGLLFLLAWTTIAMA